MSVTPKIPTLTDAQILHRIAELEKRRTLKAAIEADLAAAPAPVPELEFISGLRIEDKVHGGLIPFKLWPFQGDLIALLNANERLVVLKARQLGITWVVLAHALYCGTFWGNRLFLIVSQTGDDAIAALERIRIMVNSMPPEWRPEMIKNNTEEIVFANGSRFRAGKATKRFGRGQAAFMTIADETAFWEWADEQMTSLEAGAQRLFAVTTGNGPEDYTHRLWRRAVAGEGTWGHIFFPWHVHPDRDDDWYRENVTESSEPRLARREFAATPEEAFAAPEGVYFQRWSETNKVVMKPVHNWTTWRAVDFGFHWPACLWIQESPAGQPMVVAELAAREPFDWTTSEFADAILAKDKELGLVSPPRVTFCDPEGKGVDPQTGESEFAVFAAKGLAPTGQSSSVRDGCVRIIEAVSDPNLPLLVSDACPWLREAIGSVAPDKHKPDIYHDDSVYDHVLDTLRYYFVNRSVRSEIRLPDYSEHATVAMPW